MGERHDRDRGHHQQAPLVGARATGLLCRTAGPHSRRGDRAAPSGQDRPDTGLRRRVGRSPGWTGPHGGRRTDAAARTPLVGGGPDRPRPRGHHRIHPVDRRPGACRNHRATHEPRTSDAGRQRPGVPGRHGHNSRRRAALRVVHPVHQCSGRRPATWRGVHQDRHARPSCSPGRGGIRRPDDGCPRAWSQLRPGDGLRLVRRPGHRCRRRLPRLPARRRPQPYRRDRPLDGWRGVDRRGRSRPADPRSCCGGGQPADAG